MKSLKKHIHIIGGGLAGCEAAWQIAKHGLNVILYEMRPKQTTEAHKTALLAELVCSNSFRSDDSTYNAVGLLHKEMRSLNSLIMNCADSNRIPAGSALAVDRHGFSQSVDNAIKNEPRITLVNKEIKKINFKEDDNVIIATGPLTSKKLSDSIALLTGQDSLAFYDAIAPIVTKESINFKIAWYQSRYDKGPGDDYINCPMNKKEYECFYNFLKSSEKLEFKEWEKNTPYFEGCLPLEVMAERGKETLRFGPMKPVGLTNPHQPNIRPWAVVQLRQDNASGTLYNLVGFQTKLKYAEQKKLLKLIPGLEESEIIRYGGIHRNTFINSPKLLDPTLRLKSKKNIRFAGQITGCEGYVESSAIGLLAGFFTAREKIGDNISRPPNTTAIGSLLDHITKNSLTETYQPMNINFGLFPNLSPNEIDRNKNKKIPKREKKRIYSERAIKDIGSWLKFNYPNSLI